MWEKFVQMVQNETKENTNLNAGYRIIAFVYGDPSKEIF
jgi:hypothetical protein